MIGAVSNIILNYISIIRLDLESLGAGIYTAINQYFLLLSSLIIVINNIKFNISSPELKESLKVCSIKKILLFNGNILIRALIVISLEASFINLGATQNVTFLAVNGLLLQVMVFSSHVIRGFEMATQTMVGYLWANLEKDKLILLLKLATYFAVFTALTISLIISIFPHSPTILTNHLDVIQTFSEYVIKIIGSRNPTSIDYTFLERCSNPRYKNNFSRGEWPFRWRDMKRPY